MKPRTSLLRQRSESLATLPVMWSWASLYLGALISVALYRNIILVGSSLQAGRADTALKAVTAGLADLFVFVPQNIVLQAALIFITADLVLGTIYVIRIKTVAGAVKPIGAGIGAALLFILGLGCLSCGAVLGLVLSSLIGASLLPTALLWGGPVLVWGATLLLFALMLMLAKKVTDPFVC